MSAVTPWKVAVEEHVMLPEGPTDALLAFMDESAIERMILSPGGPGVQAEADPVRAAVEARAANDAMADAIAGHPDRWSAFATLPMQDPDAACEELERAVAELGLCGPLVNGYSAAADPESALYYDDRRYDDFWERLQDLGVPFYLHPRDPLPSQQRAYEGHPELLGAAWGFGAETALHALRLIVGGVFDRFPRVQIVLGHLGETLPFAIGRTAARLRDQTLDIAKPVDAYFREHFHVTTSGHFNEPALVASIMEMGVDRVMFALDHPFADAAVGNAWFDALDLEPADRELLGRDNAMRLFGLGGRGEATA
ncbi:MAG: amidohydrolase family protein [Solirubrobacterales bacterium]